MQRSIMALYAVISPDSNLARSEGTLASACRANTNARQPA